MVDNAQYIMNYFLNKGWTKNSICGMLGNMQSESTMNPGLWESRIEGNMRGGYGLVQWTPATVYINWANSKGYEWGSIDAQCECIQKEYENNEQWIPTTQYPMTFDEFIHSTESPNYLALVFIKNYERPFNSNQPIRGEQAEYWFNTLEGGGGVIPTPSKKKMPLYFYLKRF